MYFLRTDGWRGFKRQLGFECMSASYFFDWPSENCYLSRFTRISRPDIYVAERKQFVDYMEMSKCSSRSWFSHTLKNSKPFQHGNTILLQVPGLNGRSATKQWPRLVRKTVLDANNTRNKHRAWVKQPWNSKSLWNLVNFRIQHSSCS